jgi:hypothetical protein
LVRRWEERRSVGGETDEPPASIPNLKQFSITFLASTIPPLCASHLKINPSTHFPLAHKSTRLVLSNGPSISVAEMLSMNADLREEEEKGKIPSEKGRDCEDGEVEERGERAKLKMKMRRVTGRARLPIWRKRGEKGV